MSRPAENKQLEKLRNLYALQQIDTHLDELDEMKGDLPAEAAELEAKVNALQTTLTNLDQTMKNAFMLRDSADSEILSLKEKMERYKTQQYEVRNNKEYDALTKEMDNAAATIEKLEKEMESLETKATVARGEIETTKVQLDEATAALEEKRTALAEIARATEEEEQRYTHDREKIVVRIRKEDLQVYERIRKAKKGMAVVRVRRGSCGGCFNKVPPQKLLELRQNNTLYQCEHCGRIIVSDEIVETSSTTV